MDEGSGDAVGRGGGGGGGGQDSVELGRSMGKVCADFHPVEVGRNRGKVCGDLYRAEVGQQPAVTRPQPEDDTLLRSGA